MSVARVRLGRCRHCNTHSSGLNQSDICTLVPWPACGPSKAHALPSLGRASQSSWIWGSRPVLIGLAALEEDRAAPTRVRRSVWSSPAKALYLDLTGRGLRPRGQGHLQASAVGAEWLLANVGAPGSRAPTLPQLECHCRRAQGLPTELARISNILLNVGKLNDTFKTMTIIKSKCILS